MAPLTCFSTIFLIKWWVIFTWLTALHSMFFKIFSISIFVNAFNETNLSSEIKKWKVSQSFWVWQYKPPWHNNQHYWKQFEQWYHLLHVPVFPNNWKCNLPNQWELCGIVNADTCKKKMRQSSSLTLVLCLNYWTSRDDVLVFQFGVSLFQKIVWKSSQHNVQTCTVVELINISSKTRLWKET